ncbi:UNVERIFIED_CONTAM: hypothetical protein K2H54_042256 [Gekko kuhli]
MEHSDTFSSGDEAATLTAAVVGVQLGGGANLPSGLVCATLTGAEDIVEVAQWAQKHCWPQEEVEPTISAWVRIGGHFEEEWSPGAISNPQQHDPRKELADARRPCRSPPSAQRSRLSSSSSGEGKRRQWRELEKHRFVVSGLG